MEGIGYGFVVMMCWRDSSLGVNRSLRRDIVGAMDRSNVVLLLPFTQLFQGTVSTFYLPGIPSQSLEKLPARVLLSLGESSEE